ncbi:winged helix-turn-helix domain-containing protein [Pseudoalteromonas sp. BZB3]|uniref:winged helix-turn-helix domain-containing protein n=1 Tax=Pseudoalteromonas sp. BZB3 TaxID=3136670 RepID=UPI0032C43676
MLKFGDFIFDSQQQRLLTIQNTQVEIEPKLIALLEFFLTHPEQLISRQTLLETVWANTLVTDNAINKLVGNLRKALNDDPKQPKYIQTVPKRGYRFICTISECKPSPVNEESRVNDRQDNEAANFNLYRQFLVIVLGLFLLTAVWFVFKQSDNDKLAYSVALTREQGIEFSPRMHPDQNHLFYLRTRNVSDDVELWVKNIHTASVNRVSLPHLISEIIAVTEQDTRSEFIYLDKGQGRCDVYKARLNYQQGEGFSVADETMLFNCKDKRVKDIAYHAQKNVIYYTAQPENFWPNHIYAYDLNKNEHVLLNQPAPKGWGYHHLDVSPDGEKLLVMSTGSDHKTQLLSFNLINHQVTAGKQFDRPVYEAIWAHDSEQIFYYSSSSMQKIMQSDFDGDNSRVVVNVSERLSKRLNRIADGHSLLFSTEQDDYNLRLISDDATRSLHNSAVFDSYPALFHQSDDYLFASNRSGEMQIYFVDSHRAQSKILTQFTSSYALSNMAISPDDKQVLLVIDNDVFALPLHKLKSQQPLDVLSDEKAIFTSDVPVIAVDWLSNDMVAITAVKHAKPNLHIRNLAGERIDLPQGEWAYGLSDNSQKGNVYLIERGSHRLYQVRLNTVSDDHQIEPTPLTLPNEFYWAKIDNQHLYYMNAEGESEYLHIVSINTEKSLTKMKVNAFSSYDVKQGKVMISDKASRSGDIHRTYH